MLGTLYPIPYPLCPLPDWYLFVRLRRIGSISTIPYTLVSIDTYVFRPLFPHPGEEGEAGGHPRGPRQSVLWTPIPYPLFPIPYSLSPYVIMEQAFL
jgi:hypothetical protein